MNSAHKFGFAILVTMLTHHVMFAGGMRPIWNITGFTFSPALFYPRDLKGPVLGVSLEPQEGAEIFIPEFGKPITLILTTSTKQKAIIRKVYVYEKSWLVIYEEGYKIGIQVSYPKQGKIGVQSFTTDWERSGLK